MSETDGLLQNNNNNIDIENGDSIINVNELAKLDSLAASHYRQGKFLEASNLLKKAYNVREKEIGSEHVDTLLNLNNLGAALGRLGKYSEAEEAFRKSLIGREKVLGLSHADTLTTVNHLGVLMKQQGKFQDSETYLKRALEGFETLLGSTHLCTAETAYNYAVLSVQKGNRKIAKEYFNRAHKGLNTALGAEHQHTLDALHWEMKCSESIAALALEGGKDDMFISKKTWTKSSSCQICMMIFTMLRREHHCRVCSRSVCNDCSPNTTLVLEFNDKKPSRLCSTCEQQGY